MAAIRFTRLAEADLLGIAAYTLRTWGEEQAAHYIDELEIRCQRLAENPGSGRPCDHVRPGLRRMTQGKHVIFFRCAEDGIIVSRILHERMLPEIHDLDDMEQRE